LASSEQKYRIIVLGAGFSRPAGLPLAAELWEEIRENAPFLEGRASKFNDDLDDYIKYRRECDGLDLKPEEVDFEDFMRFLDIQHFLGLRGSDTWSKEGNEGTIVTKTLIGCILADCLAKLGSIPSLYLEFARRLQPHDTVITFNYDTLLEQALEAVGKPYRLFPTRFASVGRYGASVGDDREEVVVLKVHGSIDWFDRAGFERRLLLSQEQGLPSPSDFIWSNEDELRIVPVVDGPRFEGDPLRTIYRVKNLKALYKKRIMFLETPRMLPPSAAKIVYANQIGDFWSGMDRGGALNFGMAIVGFSMPAQDEYARQVIYSLVTNYQNCYWGETVFEKKKAPLVLVNRFANQFERNAFRNRFRFVNWERAKLHEDGFDLETLNSIFL
jgi:hypothetical protein